MVLGPSGGEHDSQKQLFLISESPRCLKQHMTKSQPIYKTQGFGNYENRIT